MFTPSRSAPAEEGVGVSLLTRRHSTARRSSRAILVLDRATARHRGGNQGTGVYAYEDGHTWSTRRRKKVRLVTGITGEVCIAGTFFVVVGGGGGGSTTACSSSARPRQPVTPRRNGQEVVGLLTLAPTRAARRSGPTARSTLASGLQVPTSSRPPKGLRRTCPRRTILTKGIRPSRPARSPGHRQW